MANVMVGLWKGINYLLAVINDIITFKLVFIIPLLILYLAYRVITTHKAKRKA